MGVFIREDELDCVEEVRLPRPVPADHDIVAGVEGFDDGLLAVGLEALDDDLLDVHDAGHQVAPASTVMLLYLNEIGHLSNIQQ